MTQPRDVRIRRALLVAVTVVAVGLLDLTQPTTSTAATVNDSSFVNPQVNGLVLAMAVQSDDKVIIGGNFTSVGGQSRNHVARLNVDGTLDSAFNPGVSSGWVESLAIQPDGKILVGGFFASVGGVARQNIARLNADGTLDTGFVPPSLNDEVQAIAVQSDGAVLIGGRFASVGGQSRSRIARLSADGTLDASFNPTVTGTAVWDIKIQPDGKVLIAGEFTEVSSTTRGNVARVDSDGTLDSTFSPAANLLVTSLALEADGDVVLGGAFLLVDGQERSRLARVSSSGALDPNFTPTASSTVSSVVVQSDGRILVGGNFPVLNGVGGTDYLGRLDTNGSLDSGFILASTPNQRLTAIALQSSGRVLIGGDFTQVGGVTRERVARLAGASVPGAPTSLVATAGNGQVSVAFTAPGSDGGAPITNYEYSVNSGVTWTPRSPTSTSSPITITGLTNGTAYRIELRAVNSVGAGTAAATGFVTPVGPPGAPVSVSATPGDRQVLVSWSSPLNTGGSPITGYTVTSSPGGFTCSPATVSTTSCTVTGLSNGTSYTFTVVAANSLGSGSASAPSGAVTPASSTTVPGAPTGVTGVAGDRQVTVSWTPPASDGGSPITGYTVTSSPGGLTCSAALTSCTVTGLTNGTDYTFTVSATNAIGTGVASSASNLVRPRGSSPNSGTSTDAEPRPAGGEADRRVVVVDEAVLDNLDRSVPTGQASVVVGGTASATVAATVDGVDAVSVGGAGWSVQVARSPLVASTRPAGSPLLIAAGGEVRITATGFSPGSSLLVALQPTGALLGTVSVDAQGRVDGVVSVPSDSLVGDSTLQVAGILPGLQVAGVAIGLLVERSAVLASRQAAKVVMIGARTDTARLSKRGQRKVRTQLGLIDQAASNVERVIVTAYPTKAEARAEEKAASRARARSTTALISDAVLPQTPVTRTRVGSITQHPDRSGKVMLTVVYRE